jgi:hypothetical protein
MPINLLLPQVTRIPITGPEPYNTLVCVQTTSNGGPHLGEKGKTSRYPLTIPTTFRLAGFDQRVRPVFEHSTTAFLSSIGPIEDDTWLFAVDDVTGAGFDQVDGSYFVNINVAVQPGQAADFECVSYGDPAQGGIVICDYPFTIQIVSYVLCYEPPLPAPPPGRPRTSTVFVDKVPPHRATSAAEQVAHQLSNQFSVGPRQALSKCDCRQK